MGSFETQLNSGDFQLLKETLSSASPQMSDRQLLEVADSLHDIIRERRHRRWAGRAFGQKDEDAVYPAWM